MLTEPKIYWLLLPWHIDYEQYYGYWHTQCKWTRKKWKTCLSSKLDYKRIQSNQWTFYKKAVNFRISAFAISSSVDFIQIEGCHSPVALFAKRNPRFVTPSQEDMWVQSVLSGASFWMRIQTTFGFRNWLKRYSFNVLPFGFKELSWIAVPNRIEDID